MDMGRIGKSVPELAFLGTSGMARVMEGEGVKGVGDFSSTSERWESSGCRALLAVVGLFGDLIGLAGTAEPFCNDG